MRRICCARRWSTPGAPGAGVIAATLLAYAALLLTAGAPALARAAWPDRAPGLAIAAWLALAGTAVASVILGGLAALLTACVMALRARYAHPGGAALAGAGAVVALAVAALAAAFPRVPAFRMAREQVARLAELAADDAAAVASPRLEVAGALLAMGAPPAGAAALGAGGSSAASRVRRLIAAPAPLSRVAAAAGALAVAALVAFPLLVVAAPAAAARGENHCPYRDITAQSVLPALCAHPPCADPGKTPSNLLQG